MSNVITFDNLRSLNFTLITASYVAIGTALPHNARIIKIVNNTDGDIFFSDDGVNDKDFYPAGSAGVYDFTTNKSEYDTQVLPMQFQGYVRYSTLPTKNDVFLINLYNRGS